MFNVFIDGKEGTTGLQIYERLEKRSDIRLMLLPDEFRKDVNARKECLNSADLCFLCLPDAAAKEAAQLVTNPSVKIIDASTAHRTNPEWVYGFPEISADRKEQIARSNRVANPGCHATGFISVVAPLIKSGMVPSDYPFVAHSITGYSGGGKKMIAEYQDSGRAKELDAPRQYALSLNHKHLPEMVNECGLKFAPVFNPIVADFYCGMCVTVPLHTRLLNKKYTPNDIKAFFTEYYATQNFVKIVESDNLPSFLSANKLAGTNNLEIIVSGNEDRILLAAVFDNLGKGASGAAVQNMNIMFGLDERVSLL